MAVGDGEAGKVQHNFSIMIILSRVQPGTVNTVSTVPTVETVNNCGYYIAVYSRYKSVGDGQVG